MPLGVMLSDLHCRKRIDFCSCARGFTALLLLAVSSHLLAKTKTNSHSDDTTSAMKPLVSNQGMKVTVHASRPQTVAFTDFSIYAEIENVSTKPIFLHPKAFTLTVPAELNPNGDDYWAIFPGCRDFSKTLSESEIHKIRSKLEIPDNEDLKCNHLDNNDRFDKVIELEPGSKTVAFWNGNTHFSASDDKTAGFWASFWKWTKSSFTALSDDINLPVGRYTFRIVGAYWDTEEEARVTADKRRRETAELDLNIVASQSTVIVGAMLGGLIAFFLLPNLRVSENPNDAFTRKWYRDLFAALLLSAIVPILLSRLSDTQFLVKVSVNDFWGAVVIGFVAAASGTKGLQKLAKI
jgi:hypothetical protein